MSAAALAEADAQIGTPEFDAAPLGVLRRLQTDDPVHWSEAIGGWLVTRYDDVLTTFKDVESFGNAHRLSRATAYLSPERRVGLKALEDHYRPMSILHSDPPDHARLRTLVLAAFSPRVIEAMRPRIQGIVDGILDHAAAAGGLEFIGDLAWELPSTVLADLLGAPADARPLFRRWTDEILAFQGVNRPSEQTLLVAQRALVDAKAYLSEMVALRRREPGDDLLSHLVQAEAEGERLTEVELLGTCITLMTAGQETTTALLGNGLYLMLTHADAHARLRDDPALVKPAVEEFLRFESPIPRQPRLVRRDTELAGQQLRAGDIAFQMLNVANRDPARFSDPDVFDIERDPNRHIGFGLGRHFCVGAPLSRLEGQVVFTSVLERFPKIRLVDPQPRWNLSKRNSRVLDNLPVRV
jgi:pimeloyl-[acyl-carrier protein] synthase